MIASRLLCALARTAPAFLIALVPAAASVVEAAQAAAAPLRREVGNLILENVPARDDALAARLDQYLQSRQATFLDWLPDGSMLIATRFGDVEQVHRVAAPLGAREQLTFFDEPIAVAQAPHTATSDGFVFLKDRGGDENAQLHYYRLADRSIRMLTDGKSLHGGPVWSHDGRRVAFHGNARDGVSYDIYIVDVAAGTPPRLAVAAQQARWDVLDWSPDDQKLLLWNYVSIGESYLSIADVATGALTPLDTTGRKIGIGSAKFSPDGRGVYYTSDEDGEFLQLHYRDLVTGEIRAITDDIPWDIDAFEISADGRYLAYAYNEDGRSKLTVVDNQQKLELQPAGLPDGYLSNLRFDRTGRRLALSFNGSQSPRDVYVFELERNALVRWTQSETGAVDPAKLVAPELVRYPTWDRVSGRQRAISAYVYRPRTGGQHPVLVYIHGGPESQYRPGFEPFFQFLVNELGYAVVAPNVRGSSGYGKTFLTLDNGHLRTDSVRDIGSLLVWIGLQPDLDRERVVVMGGSYGGYMSLATLATYNDRVRGGIDVVGIGNFVSFLENTSAYRRDLRRQEYGDERDPKTRAYLTRISPLSNVSSIRRPLLVVQGMNDPRVPASESEQMVARIRAGGGEVWYLAAKDEGHGFRKKPNRDFYLQTAASFLEKMAQR